MVLHARRFFCDVFFNKMDEINRVWHGLLVTPDELAADVSGCEESGEQCYQTPEKRALGCVWQHMVMNTLGGSHHVMIENTFHAGSNCREWSA